MVTRVVIDRVERTPAGTSPIHASSPGTVSASDAHYALFRMNEVLAKLEGFVPDSILAYSSYLPPPVALVGENELFQCTYRDWIDYAQRLLDASHNNPETAQERALLEQQVIALRYRINYFTVDQAKVNAAARELYFKNNGALESEGRDARLEDLTAIIQRYKASTSIYLRPATTPAPALTQRDQQQLMRACRTYPHFVDLLIRRNQGEGASDRLTIDFVKFCIRSGCSVSVFVKTPNERLLIAESHLDKRTGGVDGRRGICFKRQDPSRQDSPRVVSMKMFARTAGPVGEQGHYVPVQGPQNKARRVGLLNLVDSAQYGDLELPVSDVFRQFKEKTTLYNNVEYLHGKGVVNLHTVDLGSFDSHTGTIIPLVLEGAGSPARQRAMILDRLPYYLVLTQDELAERYPGQRVPQRAGEYGFAVRASRTRPNNDILDNHSYAELVVRQGNGTFKIYDFGMQPKEFPQYTYTKLLALAGTQEAGIHAPDESTIASHRQQTGIMHILGENAFNDLVIEIRDLIVEGRNGNLVFQALGENCGHFVMKLVYKFITERFRAPLYTVACNTMQGWDQNEIKRLVERALFYFDDAALNTLLDTIFTSTFGSTMTTADVDNLCLLMGGAVDLLKVTAMKDVQWNDDEIKTRIRTALTAFQNAALTAEARAEAITRFKEDFRRLIGYAVQSQQYYRMPILEADFGSPVFSYPVAFVNAIPWIWLRNLLYQFFMFVFLWSFRSRTVQERRAGTQEVTMQSVSKSVFSSEYSSGSESTINLPARLFDYPARRGEMEAGARERATAIGQYAFPREAVAVGAAE